MSGATLASLMETLAAGNQDCDGLLFGSVIRRSANILQDDGQEAQSRDEVTANIQGFSAFSRPLSFYNAMGAVNPEPVLKMVQSRGYEGDPLIGWFVHRRNTPLRPSMREKAVTCSLRALKTTLSASHQLHTALRAGSPLLLLVLSASIEPSAAIHSYQYKAYQYVLKTEKACFEPRSLVVVNIGPEYRGQYDSFAPVSSLPELRLPEYLLGRVSADQLSPPASRKSVAATAKQLEIQSAESLSRYAEAYKLSDLRSLIGPDSNGQVAQLECLYEGMLKKLRSIATAVSESSSALQKQVCKFDLRLLFPTLFGSKIIRGYGRNGMAICRHVVL